MGGCLSTSNGSVRNGDSSSKAEKPAAAAAAPAGHASSTATSKPDALPSSASAPSSENSRADAVLPAAKPSGPTSDSAQVAPVPPAGGETAPTKGAAGGTSNWVGGKPGELKASATALPPTPMHAFLGDGRHSGGSGVLHEDGAGSVGGQSGSGQSALGPLGGSRGGGGGVGGGGNGRGGGSVVGAPSAFERLSGGPTAIGPRDVCSMHAGRPMMMLDRSMGGGTGGGMKGKGRRNLTPVQLSQQASKLRVGRPLSELLKLQTRGAGRELMLLAHSFGTNQSLWQSIVDLLDTHQYTVVMFDWIGANGSMYDLYDPVRYASLRGFADDLIQLLDEMGVKGDSSGSWHQCTLIGYQQSGVVGLLASVQRPDLFKRIVAIGSSPRLLADLDYESSFQLKDLDQVFGVMQSNYRMWASGCTPVLTADDIRLPHVREFCRPLFSLRPDVGFALLKATYACDVRSMLQQVMVQTHLLLVAMDPSVPQSVVQKMLAAIPNSFAEILAVTTLHMRPDVVAAGILRHVSMPLRDPLSVSTRQTVSRRFAIPVSVMPPPRGGEEEAGG